MLRKEVAEALSSKGIRPSAIQYYTDQGIIIPGIEATSGKGTNRRYSRQNLVEILIVKELANRGVKLDVIKAIFTKMREEAAPLWNWEMNPDECDYDEFEVMFVVYDHADLEKIHITIDPIKKAAHEHPYRFTVDMEGRESVIILNVSELWRNL